MTDVGLIDRIHCGWHAIELSGSEICVNRGRYSLWWKHLASAFVLRVSVLSSLPPYCSLPRQITDRDFCIAIARDSCSAFFILADDPTFDSVSHSSSRDFCVCHHRESKHSCGSSATCLLDLLARWSRLDYQGVKAKPDVDNASSLEEASSVNAFSSERIPRCAWRSHWALTNQLLLMEQEIRCCPGKVLHKAWVLLSRGKQLTRICLVKKILDFW